VAKATIRVSVKGVDLREMMANAKEQVAELTDAKWTITEIEVWGGPEDIAVKNGMARLYSASMTLEANITE
jgi:hypothetical protein